MILNFIKLDLGNKDHLQYTYGLLKQRFNLPNTVVGAQKLPSFCEHVKNLQTKFIDFRIIYLKNVRLGIVALNTDFSLTHNYDFNSIKKHIKKITRKHFEISYAIITQYIDCLNIEKCHIKLNPRNQKALVAFTKMLEENHPSPLQIENIQLNLKYEKQ